MILISTSYSQNYRKGFIDTVFSFKPGEGQNSGQSKEFFPKNIFGAPSTKASENIAEMTEEEICSIGLGGEIIIGFKYDYLHDGDGDDFTIFENAFINPINQKVFAEPALVSVSEDGIEFKQFPIDTITLEGCAGTKPTFGGNDPFNSEICGGNSFDLKKVNLKKIKYIKIQDYCWKLLQNPNHKFYDPIISGFDLDAISAKYLINEKNCIKSNFDQANNLTNKTLTLTSDKLYLLLCNYQDNGVKISNIIIYDYVGEMFANFSNLNDFNRIVLNSSRIYLLVIVDELSNFSFHKVMITDN
jgi:hypothetical protein